MIANRGLTQVLIEKEWLAFGHPFHLRHAYGLPRGATSGKEERSPIFLQFLDCTWQLVMQLPSYFEFNPRYTSIRTRYVACFSVYRYFMLQ